MPDTFAFHSILDDTNLVCMLMGSHIRMGYYVINVVMFIIRESLGSRARGIKSMEEYAKAAFMASQSRGIIFASCSDGPPYRRPHRLHHHLPRLHHHLPRLHHHPPRPPQPPVQSTAQPLVPIPPLHLRRRYLCRPLRWSRIPLRFTVY